MHQARLPLILSRHPEFEFNQRNQRCLMHQARLPVEIEGDP